MKVTVSRSRTGKRLAITFPHELLKKALTQTRGCDWTKFANDNNPNLSMNCRGCRHDNAVAKSLFSLLKTERIKLKKYKTRNEARSETSNYNEFNYNPKRRHGNKYSVFPVVFEKQYFEKVSAV